MNSKINLRWSMFKRAWVFGLLLLLTALAGCDGDKFIMPAADEEDMMMAAMGLNCQEGVASFQVNIEAARVRTGPGVDFPAYGLAYLGEIHAISGFSEDNAWISFEFEDGNTGWVYEELVLLFCQ